MAAITAAGRIAEEALRASAEYDDAVIDHGIRSEMALAALTGNVSAANYLRTWRRKA